MRRQVSVGIRKRVKRRWFKFREPLKKILFIGNEHFFKSFLPLRDTWLSKNQARYFSYIVNANTYDT